MKTRTIVLTVALCFIGVGVCFAQNPFMGAWNLNEAKSTLAPGMPKNSTVVYEPEGLDVKVTIDGTDSTGNPTHNEYSRSYTRKGIHELDFTVKNGTNITTTGRIVASDDGKSRTVTSSGTDAQGKKFTSTAVYDKQ